MKNETAVCYVCHDDFHFLEHSMRSFVSLPVIVFVSKLAWDGSSGDWEKSAQVAKSAGAEVIIGEWDNESAHRTFALETMKARGIKWLFIPDSDEIIEPKLLETLLAQASAGTFDHFRVRMQTFWKSTSYRIFPPEELAPVILINAQTSRHLHIREYSGERQVTLGFEHGSLLHLSYVGSDERIRRKTSTWGHRTEVVSNWLENIWLGWDRDRTMRNLHPTHPECYGFAERIEVPEILRDIPDLRPAVLEPALPKNWLRISIVIPLFGGSDYIARCLKSINRCGVVSDKKPARTRPEEPIPLFFEVIVVDDCSPDDAAEVAAGFSFVKLIRNKENIGFGGSCSIGIEASSGDAVFILNSDIELTRSGVVRLGQSLMSSGTVGAVGPMTNNSGYYQMISPTMTDIANLERFAADFADRDVPDEDVSMVVGFALLVRRSVLDEVGLFDPRFGKALYEDTDLILRIQMAGYRTRICQRSFIFHAGSKSLSRTGIHPSILLAKNKQIFEDKWRLHLETGAIPYLPGARRERIQLNPDREPSVVLDHLKKLAKQVRISVCIIARDEERCIGEALDSLRGVFFEEIVLDTGSVDQTVEIIKAKGASVYEMEWPDSFSVARNASISYATGSWVFWIDSDDVVPFQTLEAIITVVSQAPPSVTGYVVPVQFLSPIPGEGTRVDHVKVFRNDPRHRFEGRIHENILGSLSGEIAKINSPILHKNYDYSEAGQKKKDKRDRKHLALDLKDRPNHPFRLFNLGMTAFFRGRFRVSQGWLRRSIRASMNQESHLRKAFSLYGTALRSLGRPEEALAINQAGLQAVGDDPELRYELARTLIPLGRLEEARDYLLGINPDTSAFFTSIDISILGHGRLNLLASVCMALGLESQAKNHLREAIQINPAFVGSAIALFETAMRTGDVVAARQAAEAVYNVQGPSAQWASFRAAIAELCGMNPEAELEQLTRSIPQAIGPGILLVRNRLNRGLVDVPLLGHLEQLGCGEAAHHLASAELCRGNLAEAQYHASLSVQLEPANEVFIAKLIEVELAFDDLIPLEHEVPSNVLQGPHAGELGPATLSRSIVIVTFNSANTISECLGRVLNSLGEHDEVIVVDNASTDNTLQLAQEFASSDSRVVLLPQSENLGYSKAGNLGMLASKGESIATLNPDAYVEDGWLEALSTELKPGVAAVGPVCDNIAGEQFVGRFLGERQPRPEEIGKILAQEQKGKVHQAKLLMGVCVMLRRETLDKHGLLCEATALGADDLELSWRLRELGYKLVVVPSVFVQHVGGASFATLPKLEVSKRIRRSDRALIQILQSYYGEAKIPSSMEIWGCDIFAEALARLGR